MKKFAIVVITIVIAVIGSAIGLTIWKAVVSNSNKREVIATVSEKEVKNYDNDSKYLVFTKDNEKVEVYAIEDELFQGRWNSSDLYGEIEEGKTYKFTIIGIRNNFFSMYPNILEAEVVKGE